MSGISLFVVGNFGRQDSKNAALVSDAMASEIIDQMVSTNVLLCLALVSRTGIIDNAWACHPLGRSDQTVFCLSFLPSVPVYSSHLQCT